MRAPTPTIDRARTLRRRMTPPEVIVWQGLRARRLDRIRFRRQHPMGPYILDFYRSDVRLAVAIDGIGHDSAERIHHDQQRAVWLAEQGVQSPANSCSRRSRSQTASICILEHARRGAGRPTGLVCLPPPPCFAWSPSRAARRCAGEEQKSAALSAADLDGETDQTQ